MAGAKVLSSVRGTFGPQCNDQRQFAEPTAESSLASGRKPHPWDQQFGHHSWDRQYRRRCPAALIRTEPHLASPIACAIDARLPMVAKTGWSNSLNRRASRPPRPPGGTWPKEWCCAHSVLG